MNTEIDKDKSQDYHFRYERTKTAFNSFGSGKCNLR